jgi:hypothetical protein
MSRSVRVVVSDGTSSGTHALRVDVLPCNTLTELLDKVQLEIHPPLDYKIMHASFWLIKDNKEDEWKHSVIAMSVSRYESRENLPRLHGCVEEGHLIPWTRWIPEGYGLFVNGANMAKWYWKPVHLRKEVAGSILVDGAPMRILEVERMCHAWESRIGREIPDANRFYTVKHCDPLSEEQLNMIAKIAGSDAYDRILRFRDAFS